MPLLSQDEDEDDLRGCDTKAFKVWFGSDEYCDVVRISKTGDMKYIRASHFKKI